jgi:replication factor A1
MKISDLKAGEGNVEVEGVIKELEDIKEINKYGRNLRLRNAVLEDDSGAIKLTLWNENVEMFQVGDKVKITNGYVNEFQGDKQLTAGKFGKIEKIGAGDVEEKTDSSTTAEEPEEASGMIDTSGEKAAEEEVKEAAEEGLL